MSSQKIGAGGKNCKEKFAGMVNDLVYKFNPNSEYNKLNNRSDTKDA